MKKKILVGSGFKMRKSVKDSINYVERISRFIEKNNVDSNSIEIFFLASFLALYPISKIISKSKILKLGAQNCWYEDRGPFTGEVSPMDLKEIGCTYVEVGHPERRDIFKENNLIINKKIKACIRNKLMPILFIGEEQKYRDKKKINKCLEKQILDELIGIDATRINEVVIAYEPIWAIGAKDAAPIEYIYDSLSFLRNLFEKEYGKNISKEQIIFYGGSVKLSNALEILEIENNDGISSGRGALDPNDFIKIIKKILSKI